MKKLGEIFTLRGVRLITVESRNCDHCHFFKSEIQKCGDNRFHCIPENRNDGQSVIFTKIIFKFGRLWVK